MRLKGKVALVSGGARGLGAAQARLMAAEGAPVVVGDVLEEEGLAVAADIKARGGQALFMPLDVTSERDWERAVDTVASSFGKLNVLVNNAGIFRRATFDETTVEGWDEVMDVNAKGVFLGTRAVLAPMRARGGGSIVNISSIAGLVGSSISAAYNASKGAVRIMTKSAALQYAADGIRVNSVHPGLSDTDMLPEVFPDVEDQIKRRSATPMDRYGTPEDVAYAVLFLASDEASFVTGAELVVDGGFTAQ